MLKKFHLISAFYSPFFLGKKYIALLFVYYFNYIIILLLKIFIY